MTLGLRAVAVRTGTLNQLEIDKTLTRSAGAPGRSCHGEAAVARARRLGTGPASHNVDGFPRRSKTCETNAAGNVVTST